MARMVTSAAEILAQVPAAKRVDSPDQAKVREWALRYRFVDATTGRLPARVVAMYRALHPGDES